MNPKFQKLGIVKVGTAEEGQEINLLDPIGEITEINLNLRLLQATFTVSAKDDRNEVIRVYPVQFSQEAWIEFFTGFFTNQIRPAMKYQYEEFKDLVQVVE